MGEVLKACCSRTTLRPGFSRCRSGFELVVQKISYPDSPLCLLSASLGARHRSDTAALRGYDGSPG
jgi:hypothetical protein